MSLKNSEQSGEHGGRAGESGECQDKTVTFRFQIFRDGGFRGGEHHDLYGTGVPVCGSLLKETDLAFRVNFSVLVMMKCRLNRTTKQANKYQAR